MKVDKSRVKDIVDEYNDIEDQLKFISSFFSWDVPPNVKKCREIHHKRLIRKLKVLICCEEAEGYYFFIDCYSY